MNSSVPIGIANIRIQRWIAIVSFLLLGVKLLAYVMTASVAILTDALESIVNVVASLISLYSLTISARPRDHNHPYGHGKIELISASIEGILISVAGLLIIYESIDRLIHPHELKSLNLGILLVAGSGLANYLIGLLGVRTGKRNNSLALIASGRHLQSDAYSTVGIIIGLGLLMLTQWVWIDSAVAIGFGFLIIFTGVKILRSSIAGIMDEADINLLKKVIVVLYSHKKENWVDLHNLRILKYGNILHLDAHLTVPWYLNVHEAHQEISAMESIIIQKFGESIELFIHTDGCLEFSCKICQKTDCSVRQHPFEQAVLWDLKNVTQDKKHGQPRDDVKS
ncbi:MAG: cation transporter [Saprospirales bacterium]|nr:cation transporter [Saprospirales bacterium]